MQASLDNENSRREILAIIPARGGSKGIPRKNIVDLGGKPLIAWTIEAALSSQRITRVIVSTDDEEIAEVSRAWGAEVPFMRPAAISGDRAYLGDVVSFTMRMLWYREGYEPDSFVLLYPTHPFRPQKKMDEMLGLLEKGRQSVRAVKRISAGLASYFVITDSGRLENAYDPRRQGLHSAGRFYRQYGVLQAVNREVQPKGEHLWIIEEPILFVDIDTTADLEVARKYVEAGLYPECAP